MATIDYNSGSGTVTFFSSNVSHPVWFCDNNTGGIQIATHGQIPIENTIQMGNLSTLLKINSATTFHSTIQLGPVGGYTTVIRPELFTVSNTSSSTSLRIGEVRVSEPNHDCWLNPNQINISSNLKKLTVTENGILAEGISLDVKGGNLNIQGTDIQTNYAGGFNSKYLTICVNNTSYKIALHDM